MDEKKESRRDFDEQKGELEVHNDKVKKKKEENSLLTIGQKLLLEESGENSGLPQKNLLLSLHIVNQLCRMSSFGDNIRRKIVCLAALTSFINLLLKESKIHQLREYENAKKEKKFDDFGEKSHIELSDFGGMPSLSVKRKTSLASVINPTSLSSTPYLPSQTQTFFLSIFQPYSDPIFMSCAKVTRWLERKRRENEEKELTGSQRRLHGNRRVRGSDDEDSNLRQNSECFVSITNEDFTAGIPNVSATLDENEEGDINSLSVVLTAMLNALKQGCGNSWFSSLLTRTLTNVDNNLMKQKKERKTSKSKRR
jgi:hypothetical protein